MKTAKNNKQEKDWSSPKNIHQISLLLHEKFPGIPPVSLSRKQVFEMMQQTGTFDEIIEKIDPDTRLGGLVLTAILTHWIWISHGYKDGNYPSMYQQSSEYPNFEDVCP